MNNEKKLRLIQVAKEFKVGLNTITDFLHKKGVTIDGSPNTQISADVYAIVEKEFGANRPSGNERESVREKISLKQTTVSIDKDAKEEKKESAPKSGVIDVKSEISQPKILGRIDLDKKNEPVKAKAEEEKPKEPEAKAEPKPEAKAEKPRGRACTCAEQEQPTRKAEGGETRRSRSESRDAETRCA